MPRISSFYGISIYMYHRDHAPPHFHAIYGEFEAEIELQTGRLIAGELPRRARRLVRDWARENAATLLRNWDAVQTDQPLELIPPLP